MRRSSEQSYTAGLWVLKVTSGHSVTQNPYVSVGGGPSELAPQGSDAVLMGFSISLP